MTAALNEIRRAPSRYETCLERLQTDHIDLVKIMKSSALTIPIASFAEGGAHEAVRDAKKAGTISLHRIHRPQRSTHCISIVDNSAAEHGFRFDTFQMP